MPEMQQHTLIVRVDKAGAVEFRLECPEPWSCVDAQNAISVCDLTGRVKDGVAFDAPFELSVPVRFYGGSDDGGTLLFRVADADANLIDDLKGM